MLNLDDLTAFAPLDTRGLLQHIAAWPAQLAAAWTLGQSLALPENARAARHILLAGRGDSALAGELARQAAQPTASLPITLWTGAEPPAWLGAETLVIALSHSGETPATLALAEAAQARGAALLAVTRGGRLANVPGGAAWRYTTAANAPDGFVPLAALTLAALHQLDLFLPEAGDLAEAEAALRHQQAALHADSPLARNPAKRMAGQLFNRAAALFVTDDLAPAGRWWQGQINQQAKAWATCQPLAESDHALAGRFLPETLSERTLALFLRGAAPSPAADAARLALMTAGFNTDVIAAAGRAPLTQLVTLAQYGSYVAYYLALCYGVDPGVPAE